MSTSKTNLFAVKTTIGQEKNVAQLLSARLKAKDDNIVSILVLPSIRGYVFVEARGREKVVTTLQGIRHVRGKPAMPVSIDEISVHLVQKPVIDTLSSGDSVEIIAGPLRGITGKVVRVDKPKREITIELMESAFPLPISVPADHVRPAGAQKKV